MLVMGQPHDLLGEFPAELAERLQRMADVQTAGTSPWPGVDRAVQRAHRRRVAGIATGAAASVLVVGLAVGGLLDPGSNHSQSAVPIATTAPALRTTTTSTKTLVPLKAPERNLTPAEAGYPKAIGGSLAKDRAWQSAMRVQLSQIMGGDEKTVNPNSDVLLLWAGDVNATRYALLLYRNINGPRPFHKVWYTALAVGPAGADADAMTFPGGSGIGIPQDEADFDKARSKTAKFAGTVFVKAVRARSVEVATSRRFSSDGTVTTTWRPLQKQGGSVWVGQLNAAELHLADYRVDGRPTGGGGPAQTLVEGSPSGGAATIAPAGTDREALRLADEHVQALGASNEETPVVAESISLGGGSTLAAAVLRSPDGGYLFAFAERHPVQRTEIERSLMHFPGSRTLRAGALSRNRFTTADSFMAAVKIQGSTKTTPAYPRRHYLVVAPKGAATVRVQGVSAKVVNRLAVLDFRSLPDTYALGDQIEALEANGTVIGRVTAFNGTDDADPDQRALISVSEQPAHP
jgi:hypothetical protein